MIILIAGTNGAGKTHLMRRILAKLPEKPDLLTEVKVDGKSGPKMKRIASTWLAPYDITILGKYDGPTCGGCDCYSWKGASDDLERVVTEEVKAGRRVLLEGLIVATWGQDRMKRLKDLGLVVVQLSTPLEACLDAVNGRRKTRAEAEGKEYTPVNPDNPSSKHRFLEKVAPVRRGLGVEVLELDRESAYRYVVEALGMRE